MSQPPSLPLDDAEQFAAIWQRVCPDGCGDYLSPDVPALPAPAGSDTPAEMGVFLREEIAAGHAYLPHRRRSRCCAVWPELGPMARACRQEARELAAALFLLTGVRYLPARRGAPQRWSSLAECCRALFYRERRAAGRFRQAAPRAQDPALTALFARLAEQSALRQEALSRLIARAL